MEKLEQRRTEPIPATPEMLHPARRHYEKKVRKLEAEFVAAAEQPIKRARIVKKLESLERRWGSGKASKRPD